MNASPQRAWSARNQRADMRPFIVGQLTRVVVVPAAFRRSDTALSEKISRWTVGRPDMALFIFTRAILANEPIQIFNHGRMARDFHGHRRYRRRLVCLVDRLPIPNANCAASKQTRHVVSELSQEARTNAQAIPKGNGGRRHGTDSTGRVRKWGWFSRLCTDKDSNHRGLMRWRNIKTYRSPRCKWQGRETDLQIAPVRIGSWADETSRIGHF